MKEGQPLTFVELESRVEGAGKYVHGLFRFLQSKVREGDNGDLDSWVFQFDSRLNGREKSRLEQIARETGATLLGGGALAFLPEWLERCDGAMRTRILTAQREIGGEKEERLIARYQKEIDGCTKTLEANKILRQKLQESGKIASE